MSSERITAGSPGPILGTGAPAAPGRRAEPVPAVGPEAQPAGRRAALATGVASVALGLMVVISLAYVSVAASRESILSPPSHAAFPDWMAGPLGPLASWFRPSDEGRRILLTAVVVGMYLCYLVVIACGSRLRPGVAIAAIVAIDVIFFLSPPLSLTDVFNYINYGRMEVLHGLNPYATIPALGPHSDPSFPLSNWHALLSPYGPLFTLYTFALVPLGVAASFWVLKGSLLLASLACLWLVWRCAELLGRDPLRATLFVGLNPLVLVWGLGGDHNDFFTMLFVLLAVYLLLEARARATAAGPDPGAPTAWGWGRLVGALDGARRPLGPGEPGPGREVGAGFLLMAAVAVKASAGLLLPVVLCGARRRLRVLGGMLVGLVVLGGASVYAFGAHLPNLAQQSTLVTLVGLPNVIGYLLGYGGETDTMKLVLAGILLAAVAGVSIWTWRTRDWVRGAGYATVAVLVTLSWTLPWYVLWLLPFAALARGRGLRIAALVISLYLMLAWVPLMTNLIHSFGFKPSLTELGQKRQAKTLLLLH
ncbi:MAG: alpha,6-mannosyltransferase [Solirubrobacteraceae bacterium]|nr:alpha,6-mannosyltransferase [Solirubrobacteraceae bacterium]